MTASNLDEVRKAAERSLDWVDRVPNDHPYSGDGPEQDNDAITLATFALVTIPANPTAPITPEWLRECWGFESFGQRSVVLETKTIRLTWKEIPMSFGATLESITTRHQFTQLATALGLQPKLPPAPATQPENSPGK